MILGVPDCVLVNVGVETGVVEEETSLYRPLAFVGVVCRSGLGEGDGLSTSELERRFWMEVDFESREGG
jgi:hypothetical protein